LNGGLEFARAPLDGSMAIVAGQPLTDFIAQVLVAEPVVAEVEVYGAVSLSTPPNSTIV
jgi:hypothetical protein